MTGNTGMFRRPFSRDRMPKGAGIQGVRIRPSPPFSNAPPVNEPELFEGHRVACPFGSSSAHCNYVHAGTICLSTNECNRSAQKESSADCKMHPRNFSGGVRTAINRTNELFQQLLGPQEGFSRLPTRTLSYSCPHSTPRRHGWPLWPGFANRKGSHLWRSSVRSVEAAKLPIEVAVPKAGTLVGG